MQNTAAIKTSLHQMIIENYDHQLLSQVQAFFQNLQEEKTKDLERKLALKRMLAAQEGEQELQFA